MRKHRLTVLCVSALGALGVISSGFAGWVITMGPKEASGTGSITADGVVARQGVESWVVDSAEKTIRFAANGTSASNGWLTASGKEEKMSATFKFTITTTKENMTVNFTDLKFEETDADKKYAAAYNQGEGLVGSLPAFGAATGNGVGTIALEGAALGSDSKTATAAATSTTLNVTFTVTFAWGQKFGYKNPLDYYNASPYNSSLDSEATKNIGDLGNLTGATFALSFNVSATPKA